MKQKSQQPINDAEYRNQYAENKNQYDKLGVNLVQALELLLKENQIEFLVVYYRIKEDSSFVEKIKRKQYAQPFEQTEDICGIRIICYYLSDIDKIGDIIEKEFEVLERKKMQSLLKSNQFGYRSDHFNVKIKNEWTKAPNYRKLENLKAEIQIRTVLMHAWAEIEHKLAYKNENQIEDRIKRILSRISSKLEESDEQFEELRKEVTNYKDEITESFEKNEYEDVELNFDSFVAFIDKKLPYKTYSLFDLSDFLNNFQHYNFKWKDLLEAFEKTEKYLPQIEKEWFKITKDSLEPIPNWTRSQGSTAFVIMSLFNEDFREKFTYTESFEKLFTKYCEMITTDEAAKTKPSK